jgi:hypothetical protein
LETVYRQHPGFDPKAQTAFSLDLGAPAELPDSLRGEAWQFVQLPLSTLVAELEDVRRVRPCQILRPIPAARRNHSPHGACCCFRLSWA